LYELRTVVTDEEREITMARNKRTWVDTELGSIPDLGGSGNIDPGGLRMFMCAVVDEIENQAVYAGRINYTVGFPVGGHQNLVQASMVGYTGGVNGAYNQNAPIYFDTWTGVPVQADAKLGGMVAIAVNGATGITPFVVLVNPTWSKYPVTIVHEDPASTAVNRFSLPGGRDIVLDRSRMISFDYNPTSTPVADRWVIAQNRPIGV
jgi:hypothetical protein